MVRHLLSVLTAVLLALPAGEPAGDGRLSSRYEEVQVRLVQLHATVSDRRGETVDGLGPGDFLLRENGIPQKITVFGTAAGEPVKIAFLLDVSGSMAVRGKLDLARDAIRNFAEQLQPQDEVALLIFADGDVVVELPFTPERQRLDACLSAVEAYGQTALRDALAYAPGLLSRAAPGRKALVLVTDGIDNASTMTNLEAIQTAQRLAVPVYIIGLTDLPRNLRATTWRPGAGRSFFEVLEAFSSTTGGSLFPVFHPEEASEAVAAVRERLRGQYLIGYHPTGSDQATGFQQIELQTTHPRHTVHTRRGYYLQP